MTLLNQNIEGDISLHRLGFIEVRLDGDQKLCVWHPDLPRAKGYCESQIHDNAYGFKSQVLRGVQIQDVFVVNNSIKDTRSDFWLNHVSHQTIGAGMTYQLKARVFHSTTACGDGRVAALVTKVTKGHDAMRLMGSVGMAPYEEDFDSHQMNKGTMWAIVCEVLGDCEHDAY